MVYGYAQCSEEEAQKLGELFDLSEEDKNSSPQHLIGSHLNLGHPQTHSYIAFRR
jgi:cyanate lyase